MFKIGNQTQVSIYLPDDILQKLDSKVAEYHRKRSSYVKDLIKDDVMPWEFWWKEKPAEELEIPYGIKETEFYTIVFMLTIQDVKVALSDMGEWRRIIAREIVKENKDIFANVFGINEEDLIV